MIDEPDPYETTGLDGLWAAVLTADPDDVSGTATPDGCEPLTFADAFLHGPQDSGECVEAGPG